MRYYSIMTLNDKQKNYGGFLNEYEPSDEMYDFQDFSQEFKGFSSTPIIFKRDTRYKNTKPISDFLVNDWGERIVSERVADMLKAKYADEIDFYECFAEDNGVNIPYYILRPKFELDVLDNPVLSLSVTDALPCSIFFCLKNSATALDFLLMWSTPSSWF